MSSRTYPKAEAPHTRMSRTGWRRERPLRPDFRRRGALLAVACLTLLPAIGLPPPAMADADDPWPVRERLLGRDGQRSKDVSGIACARDTGFPRTCVIIDDERQAAQLVTVTDGALTAGPSIPLIADRFDGKALELDGEGVAYADGFFYVIGSHGHPRDTDGDLTSDADKPEIAARIAADSRILRFRLGAGGTAEDLAFTTRLRAAIAAEPVLKPHFDQRLEDGGVTIEGIAIRGDRLLAGFRGPPLEGGKAAVLSVSRDALFGAGDLEPRLFLLPVGEGQGVRDLAAFGEGVLVLSGPSAAGPGPYAISWWDGTTGGVKPLADLSPHIREAGHKPEAILPLDVTSGTLRVLVFFDGAREGRPVAVRMPAP